MVLPTSPSTDCKNVLLFVALFCFIPSQNKPFSSVFVLSLTELPPEVVALVLYRYVLSFRLIDTQPSKRQYNINFFIHQILVVQKHGKQT